MDKIDWPKFLAMFDAANSGVNELMSALLAASEEQLDLKDMNAMDAEIRTVYVISVLIRLQTVNSEVKELVRTLKNDLGVPQKRRSKLLEKQRKCAKRLMQKMGLPNCSTDKA